MTKRFFKPFFPPKLLLTSYFTISEVEMMDYRANRCEIPLEVFISLRQTQKAIEKLRVETNSHEDDVKAFGILCLLVALVSCTVHFLLPHNSIVREIGFGIELYIVTVLLCGKPMTSSDYYFVEQHERWSRLSFEEILENRIFLWRTILLGVISLANKCYRMLVTFVLASISLCCAVACFRDFAQFEWISMLAGFAFLLQLSLSLFCLNAELEFRSAQKRLENTRLRLKEGKAENIWLLRSNEF